MSAWGGCGVGPPVGVARWCCSCCHRLGPFAARHPVQWARVLSLLSVLLVAGFFAAVVTVVTQFSVVPLFLLLSLPRVVVGAGAAACRREADALGGMRATVPAGPDSESGGLRFTPGTHHPPVTRRR